MLRNFLSTSPRSFNKWSATLKSEKANIWFNYFELLFGSQNFLNHYSWQFIVIILTDTFSKAISIEKWKLELLSKQFQVTWSLLNISKNWKTIQYSSDVMNDFAFSTEINLASVALWFHLNMPGSWNFIRLSLDLPPRFSMVGC